MTEGLEELVGVDKPALVAGAVTTGVRSRIPPQSLSSNLALRRYHR